MQQRLDRLSEKDKNGRAASRTGVAEAALSALSGCRKFVDCHISGIDHTLRRCAGRGGRQGIPSLSAPEARLPKSAQSWSSLFSMPLTVSHRGFDDRETGELCFVLSRLTLALRSVLLNPHPRLPATTSGYSIWLPPAEQTMPARMW